MLLRVVTGQAEKLFDLEVLKKSKLSEDLNSKLLGYSNKLGPFSHFLQRQVLYNLCVPELTALTSLSLAFSLNKGLIKNSAKL